MAFDLELHRNLILPRHIVAGLGTADRNLLSLSLALFDDSKLTRHLERLIEKAQRSLSKLLDREIEDVVVDVQLRMEYWQKSCWSCGLPYERRLIFNLV